MPLDQKKIGTQITSQLQYYLNKRMGEKVMEEEINENQKNEIREIRQSPMQQGQQIDLMYKQWGSENQSPKIKGSPIINDNSQQFKAVVYTPDENINRINILY